MRTSCAPATSTRRSSISSTARAMAAASPSAASPRSSTGSRSSSSPRRSSAPKKARREHQLSMPEVPMPEDVAPTPDPSPEQLARLPSKVQRWLSRQGPFEFRHVYPRDELNPPKRPPFQHVWFRLGERVGDAPELHRALLAYASDFHLLGTATFPHGISYYQPNVLMASLDHALWFHRPFRADEWLLYSIDSPSCAGRARAGARPDLRPQRQAGGEYRAGRPDPRDQRSEGLTCGRCFPVRAWPTSKASRRCSPTRASKCASRTGARTRVRGAVGARTRMTKRAGPCPRCGW